MATTVADLQSVYEDLLRTRGLDRFEQSVESVTESFEAMARAGWIDAANLDRASAYEQMVEGSKAAAYNPLLAAIASDVENDIRLRDASVPCSVFIGGYPLGEVQACISREGDGALILFNHGLMQLIYQIGKVFLLSYDWLCVGTNAAHDIAVFAADDGFDLPQPGPAVTAVGWEPCGWTRQRSVTALNAILYAYEPAGTVTTTPRQQLPTEGRAATLAALVEQAEKFVIAHEYAHLLLGHLHGNVVDLDTPGGLLKGVLSHSHERELKADELAASLLFASCNSSAADADFDVNVRSAGIALFFVATMLYALTLDGPTAVGLDAQPSDAHPTPNSRLLEVLKFLHRRYGRSGTRLARMCMGWLCETIADVESGLADLTQAREIEDHAQDLYQHQRYANAIPLWRQVISLREAALGDSAVELAAPLTNLATCLSRIGESRRTERLLLRSVSICESAGTLARHYLATSLNNLASHYVRLGRYEEAERYFRRALEQAEAQLADAPDPFAVCFHNYLGLLDELKRDAAVESLCKHAVAATRRILGEQHPLFLSYLNTLARFYKDRKRYDDAVRVFEGVVSIARRGGGRQPTVLGPALSELARSYFLADRLEEAEKAYDEVLLIASASLGENDPMLAKLFYHLGSIYEKWNRWDEAASLFRRAVQIMTAAGADHPNTSMFLVSLERVTKRNGASAADEASGDVQD